MTIWGPDRRRRGLFQGLSKGPRIEGPLPPAPNMLHSGRSPMRGKRRRWNSSRRSGAARRPAPHSPPPRWSAGSPRFAPAWPEKRLDACLFTSYHNIAYFSDFLYTAFGRPFGLVVTHEGQTTITPNVDGGQPWRRTFGDNLVYTDWHRDNYFAAVKALIPEGSRVGVEFDHLTVEGFRKLQGALPTSELVDAGKARHAPCAW